MIREVGILRFKIIKAKMIKVKVRIKVSTYTEIGASIAQEFMFLLLVKGELLKNASKVLYF